MTTETAPHATGRVTPGTWASLLLTPVLTLLNLSVTYALVTPSCSRQTTLALHVVTLVVAAICTACTLAAARQWRRGRAADAARASDAAAARPGFLALVAVMVGVLSTLVVLAQWMPQWLMSPCAN